MTPQVVEYMNSPLSAEQLGEICCKLGVDARSVLRASKKDQEALGLEGASDARVLDAIASDPKLMVRPIVVNGDRAAIGRPPENVLDIL